MNKFTFLICALVFITNLYAQEKSIAVDIQTPGTLSSLLTYPQQQSVEELTVTGYINKADMSFINGLIQNHNLKILDLADVNLAVASYGDNVIWYDFLSFGNKKELQKFIMPNNINGIKTTSSSYYAIISSRIDSLIIKNRDLSVFDPFDGEASKSFISYYAPHHLLLEEGVEIIPNKAFYFYAEYDTVNCLVTLPNTIKNIGGGAFSYKCTFNDPLTLPNSIEYLGRHPLKYDSYYNGYYDLQINVWWVRNSSLVPISSTRFEFPKEMKYYNSFHNSFTHDVFTSDTIVVYEHCDTLLAKLNAKIGYFFSPKPFYSYYSSNFSYNVNIDTIYVPEGCGDLYSSYYAGNNKIKAIKEMLSVKSIEISGTSNKCYVGEEFMWKCFGFS